MYIKIFIKTLSRRLLISFSDLFICKGKTNHADGAVDLYVSVTRSKYKIQKEREPQPRNTKKEKTLPEKEKGIKSTINDMLLCCGKYWFQSMMHARDAGQTNIFCESACNKYGAPTCIKCVCRPHVSRDKRKKRGANFCWISMKCKMSKSDIQTVLSS